MMGYRGEPTDSSSPQQARHGSHQTQAWQQLTLDYLRDLPRQLEVVVRLLATEDYGAIRDHAHRMKGTSGTYRLNSIAEQLARLERLAVDQDRKQIAALVDAIITLVKREAKAMESPVAPHDEGKPGETND